MSPLFQRVVLGVDGSRHALAAVRQAARLTAPDGTLHLIAATDHFDALAFRWGPYRLADEPGIGADFQAVLADMHRHASAALAHAAEAAGSIATTTRVEDGDAAEVLRAAVQAEQADLVAIGAPAGTRLAALGLGSTATALLRDAPCSVLIARQPFDQATFPVRIAVGVDGSAAATRAATITRDLTAATGARSVAVLGTAGRNLDHDAAIVAAGDLPVHEVHDRPLDALLSAGARSDLLVVASRGLRGLLALGSVSERVAHRCECSVLVVR